jgi:hypothetical protein
MINLAAMTQNHNFLGTLRVEHNLLVRRSRGYKNSKDIIQLTGLILLVWIRDSSQGLRAPPPEGHPQSPSDDRGDGEGCFMSKVRKNSKLKCG